MVSDVEVRQAGPDDIAELYQVTRRSRRDAFGDLLPSAALDWESTVPEAYREFIEEILANDEKALLVAKQEGSIVGLAELVWDAGETAGFVDDTDAELVAILVDPDHWNEGIGTRLLEEVCLTVPDHLVGITLSVLTENTRARAFYERRGFERTGTTVTHIAETEQDEAVYRRTGKNA